MVSMFRLEIIADKIDCLVKCKEINIKSDFGNIFSLYLEKVYKNTKNKSKEKPVYYKYRPRNKKNVLYKKTVDLITPVDDLIENMLVYPLNITIEMKHHRNTETGTVQVQWKEVFLEFVNSTIYEARELTEIGKYDLYHDVTSKRVATILLKINLLRFNHNKNSENISDFFERQSDSNCSTYIGKQNNFNAGIIKTRYRGKELSEYIKREEAKKSENLDIKALNKSQFLNTKEDLRNQSSNIVLNDDNYYFSNQVYCLGYCTIENNLDKETKHPVSKRSSLASTKKSSAVFDNKSSTLGSSKYSLTSDKENEGLIQFTKCDNITCDNKMYKEVPQKVDSKIIITLQNFNNMCCEQIPTENGGVKIKKADNNSCYCACECSLGFDKKTKYCNVCGGYEIKGKELSDCLKHDLPHPCPLYHKLMDLNKSRSFILSTSGSGSRSRSLKLLRSKSQMSNRRRSSLKDFGSRNTMDSITSYKTENLDKKGKKEGKGKTVAEPEISGKSEKYDKDKRFKFNYGYQGIPPQIGHSKCAIPCKGPTLNSNVPRSMGWLWTAENIPGMKVRPSWKPGATHKHVVQLLKVAKNPGIKTSKKKRKSDSRKRRKNDKKPLLIIHKKDGEFNVTMETMKLFQKQRTFNQYPYEDKPALTYSIGRTDEENLERLKKKTRALRRLEREKREFIDSSFKNMCEEICVKTYQQAIGILPGTEDPDCACFPALPDPDKYSLNHSCSCSEDRNSWDSETDSDEWVVEFTPPNAKFDPVYKIKKTVKNDNSTQYDYLDYRVKILSRSGNPIPRFFKGPDGKQQCSDLGGFWSPDKRWLEINVDGYIAPDGRWAPESFTGPNGEQIETNTGKFQTINGNWLVVGADGYVDFEGKWKFYRGKREILKRPTQSKPKRISGSGDRKFDKEKKVQRKRSAQNTATTWSCFGDNISPKYLTEMGILGHGQDKVLLKKSVTEMMSKGVNVKIPQVIKTSLSTSRYVNKSFKKLHVSHSRLNEQQKCHHSPPSAKGIVAVDEFGNKVYFKLRNYKNSRPRDRAEALKERGISTSSFHVPCLSSFISSELIKEQQRKRIFELAAKHNV